MLLHYHYHYNFIFKVVNTNRRLSFVSVVPKDAAQDTFTEKLVTNVIKNLEVKITNIHVRYEDTFTNPQKPFSVGVTLREISCLVSIFIFPFHSCSRWLTEWFCFCLWVQWREIWTYSGEWLWQIFFNIATLLFQYLNICDPSSFLYISLLSWQHCLILTLFMYLIYNPLKFLQGIAFAAIVV